ncbi:uncharacterized protein LOC134217803 [Armigeres subalbatus]|uniref:uncharacterized protein LOC134217803 n=1 Tax=Armigeres subalbatus TaxID=124917 RepID=UPI002ED1BC59
MGNMCIEYTKFVRIENCLVILLTHFIITVNSGKYFPSKKENNFDDDYLDDGTLQQIKRDVYASSARYKNKFRSEDDYTYADYEGEESSFPHKPTNEIYEKHGTHPVLVKPVTPPIVYKSPTISKEMVIMIVLALKALFIAMVTIGLPALIGLYLLIVAKMVMGLKAMASTNAFTLGVLSTKYLSHQKHANAGHGAAIIPFYVPLALSSILSSAGLITGAVGLIASIFANSTTNSSTTTTTTTTTTETPTEAAFIKLTRLPSKNKYRPVKPKHLDTLDDDPPEENVFSKVARKASDGVKNFVGRFTKSFKNN